METDLRRQLEEETDRANVMEMEAESYRKDTYSLRDQIEEMKKSQVRDEDRLPFRKLL